MGMSKVPSSTDISGEGSGSITDSCLGFIMYESTYKRFGLAGGNDRKAVGVDMGYDTLGFTPAEDTYYYVELKRTSDSEAIFTVRTGSHEGTVVQTKTNTGNLAGASDLQYLGFYMMKDSASGGAFVTEVDQITIHNAVTSVTPATWTRGFFNARGVFGNGYIGSNVNVVDYITISTPANATDFGDLSVSRRALGSVANDTRGVFGGGYASSAPSGVIDYITIATPANATDFGDLSTTTRSGVVGAGNDTTGLFAGGESPKVTSIESITIDTASNASSYGNLSVARKGGGATSDKTRAIFLGGESGETTMDYVTIANGGTASTGIGTFSQGSYAGHCGTISDGTRGIFAIGGSSASGGYNIKIVYKTIATTANATDFGNLTQGRSDGGQVGDSTRGAFGGGKYTSGGTSGVTTIDYITIATAGNATSFGSLTSARYATTGLSDGQ